MSELYKLRTIALAGVFLIAIGCSPTAGTAPNTTPDDAGNGDVEQEDIGSDTDDADVAPAGPPIFEVSPHFYTFTGVEIDDSESTLITLRNLGESSLRIHDIELEHFETPEDYAVLDAGEEFQAPLSIPPSSVKNLHLVYTPQSEGANRGDLVITSDDPDNPEAVVRIESVSAYPELEAPDRITFGTVEPGEELEERVALYNRGLYPLLIESVDIGEDSLDPGDFHVGLDGTDELPDSLDQGSFFYLDVTFSPNSEGTKRAEIVIENSDPSSPEHTIEVSGNRPEPCLQSSGDVDFGMIGPGDEATETLHILNCSMSTDLDVSDIEIIDDADGTFAIVGDLDDTISVSPLSTLDIELTATLSANQEVVGRLQLSSDDPESELIEHQLRVAPLPE